MTNVNFKACFDAEFVYDPTRTLVLAGNEVINEVTDANDEPIRITVYKSAKQVLDDKIFGKTNGNEILKSATVTTSTLDVNSAGVMEYEANMFDFGNDIEYERVLSEAELAISEIELNFTNTRGYAVGKYVCGNSYGIKIVITVF